MDRLLTCDCGEKIIVTRAQAGQQVPCQSCKKANQVPTLRGLESLPAASPALPTAAKSPTNNWGWRGPVLAFCFIGMVIGAVYASNQFYASYQTNTGLTTDLHIEQVKEGFGQGSVDALLDYWDKQSQIRVNTRYPEEYKLYNDFSATARRKGIVAAGIFGLLVAIAIAITKSAKKVTDVA